MRNLSEIITVSANQSARTFTIRKTYPNGEKVKYRTNQMSQQEFDCEERNTDNDWKNFLKVTEEYYEV